MLKKLSYVGLFMILAFLVGFRLWQKQVRKDARKQENLNGIPGNVELATGRQDSLYFLEKDSNGSK